MAACDHPVKKRDGVTVRFGEGFRERHATEKLSSETSKPLQEELKRQKSEKGEEPTSQETPGDSDQEGEQD